MGYLHVVGMVLGPWVRVATHFSLPVGLKSKVNNIFGWINPSRLAKSKQIVLPHKKIRIAIIFTT